MPFEGVRTDGAGRFHRFDVNGLKPATPYALGTGDLAFPPAYRGVPASPSALGGLDSALGPAEKNGFTVVDVTSDELTFALFTFRPPERAEQIDTLRPAIVYEVPRKA